MDPVTFLLWRFYAFFRDPDRSAPEGDVIVAPADGRVLYVKEVDAGHAPVVVKDGVAIPVTDAPDLGPVDLPGVLVGIYMYPWSVHVNRAPIGGRVAHVVARPARDSNRSMVRSLMHLVWGMPISDEIRSSVADNARNTIVIDGEIPVAVVQIADRYVRAIDCFVREGNVVARGDPIGMIRMGSQCDLFVRRSRSLQVFCRPGDLARAGETVLARYGA